MTTSDKASKTGAERFSASELKTQPIPVEVREAIVRIVMEALTAYAQNRKGGMSDRAAEAAGAILQALGSVGLGEPNNDLAEREVIARAAAGGEEPTPADCQRVMMQGTKPYPRTCPRCRLGPCPYFPKAQPARSALGANKPNNDLTEREVIARIVDPKAFENWLTLAVRASPPEADRQYGKPVQRALSKADSILKAIALRSSGGVGVREALEALLAAIENDGEGVPTSALLRAQEMAAQALSISGGGSGSLSAQDAPAGAPLRPVVGELPNCPFTGKPPSVSDYRETSDETGEVEGYASVESTGTIGGWDGPNFFVGVHANTLDEAKRIWTQALSPSPEDGLAVQGRLAEPLRVEAVTWIGELADRLELIREDVSGSTHLNGEIRSFRHIVTAAAEQLRRLAALTPPAGIGGVAEDIREAVLGRVAEAKARLRRSPGSAPAIDYATRLIDDLALLALSPRAQPETISPAGIGSRPQEGGWRPIESAPKDGTVFAAASTSRYGELYDSASRKPYVAWWAPGGDFSEPGWAREVFNGRTSNHVAYPTHWMPLPTPPTAEGSEPQTGAAPHPPAPWPMGTLDNNNARRTGWAAYFDGKRREDSPFPSARPDLREAFECGFDAAAEHHAEPQTGAS